jgi:hypothetical protein
MTDINAEGGEDWTLRVGYGPLSSVAGHMVHPESLADNLSFLDLTSEEYSGAGSHSSYSSYASYASLDSLMSPVLETPHFLST